MYDTYRAVYLSDPFTDTLAARPSFQTFLRDLPARVPDWIAGLLFGALWLIPCALTYWTLREEFRDPVPILPTSRPASLRWSY